MREARCVLIPTVLKPGISFLPVRYRTVRTCIGPPHPCVGGGLLSSFCCDTQVGRIVRVNNNSRYEE